MIPGQLIEDTIELHLQASSYSLALFIGHQLGIVCTTSSTVYAIISISKHELEMILLAQ